MLDHFSSHKTEQLSYFHSVAKIEACEILIVAKAIHGNTY